MDITLTTAICCHAGIDPLAALRRSRDRIDSIAGTSTGLGHRVMGRRIRVFDACVEGVMCPIGRRVIDDPAIRAFLAEKGRGRVMTVEQERDPPKAGGSLADVKASRDYRKSVGYRGRGT